MLEERVKRVAERVIESAKAEIYLNLKFTWLALERLTFVVEDGFREMRTDGNSIFVGAQYLLTGYQKKHRAVSREIVHVAVHCLFRHFAVGVGEQAELWDLATDIFAEKTVDDFHLPFLADGGEEGRRAVYETLQKALPAFTAEGIYTHLLALQEGGQELPARALFFRDGHDLWARSAPSYYNQTQEQESLQKEWQEIAGKVLADLQFFHPESGEAMQKSLQADARKKLSYRAFLKKMLRPKEFMKEDPEEFDYVFYSYGLSLYGNMPLIEQLEYREEEALSTLCVVIDTSGSTYQNLVQRFLDQTYAVVSETAKGKFRLCIMQCDETVRRVDVVETLADFHALTQDFTLIGGGGTDFRPAFQRIDEMMETGELPGLKGVLYFTDGEGIYPKKARPYETAFVFYDERYEDKNVPPWAMKLIVGEKEITAK